MKKKKKMIEKTDLRSVRDLFDKSDKSPESMRKAFFSVIRMYDKVPSDLVPIVLKFASLFYDKSGIGYHGVIAEISDRVSLYADIDGYVFAKEFLLHRAGNSDIYDKENRISYEKKTGCGDWLRSENPVFAEVIKEYERKKTLIRWDYDFEIESKKNGKERFSIHIETTFKKLFTFLSEFEGGFDTWWKENGRSGKAGVYVWEMQTIKTSRKKAVYLTTFDTWNKTH